MAAQILDQSNFLKFSVKHFFPFGGAWLTSISTQLRSTWSCSLSSKLTMGHDWQSLEAVEKLQAPWVSVVDPLLLLLVTVTRKWLFFFCSMWHYTNKNYIIRKFHLKILFQRNQHIIHKKFLNNVRVPIGYPIQVEVIVSNSALCMQFLSHTCRSQITVF